MNNNGEINCIHILTYHNAHDGFNVYITKAIIPGYGASSHWIQVLPRITASLTVLQDLWLLWNTHMKEQISALRAC